MIATFPNSVEFVSNLKAALRAVCEDDTRAHMCCIRVEIGNGLARFVATNGHWLWVNEILCREVTGVDEKGKDVELFADRMTQAVVSIPREDVKRIVRAMDKTKKAQSWRLELDTSKRTVTQLAKSVSFGPEVGKFPPYQQIIPSSVSVTKRPAVCADFRYIGAIVAAFEDIVLPNKAGNGITIEPTGGERDPLVVTSKDSSALVVLMPRCDERSGEGHLSRYRTKSAKPAAKAPVGGTSGYELSPKQLDGQAAADAGVAKVAAA